MLSEKKKETVFYLPLNFSVTATQKSLKRTGKFAEFGVGIDALGA